MFTTISKEFIYESKLFKPLCWHFQILKGWKFVTTFFIKNIIQKLLRISQVKKITYQLLKHLKVSQWASDTSSSNKLMARLKGKQLTQQWEWKERQGMQLDSSMCHLSLRPWGMLFVCTLTSSVIFSHTF